MPRAVKKFCSINQWLQKVDNELYGVFDALCLHRLLAPARNTTGVTFLYPEDKKYKKSIVDAAYGETPEKAVQMLKSLVIKAYLSKTSDFISQRDDIPNKLGQKIEVTSADSTSVTLVGGGKLKKPTGAKTFDPRADRVNMAVYMLSGGKPIPLDGKKSDMKYAQGNPQKTGGAYLLVGQDPQAMMKNDIGEQNRSYKVLNENQNIYAERVLSFFDWSIANTGMLKKYASCFRPTPEFSYKCLMAFFDRDASDYRSWVLDTKAIYVSTDKDIHKEYASRYGEFAEKIFAETGEDYKKTHEALITKRGGACEANRLQFGGAMNELYSGDNADLRQACDKANVVGHDAWAEIVRAESANEWGTAMSSSKTLMTTSINEEKSGGHVGGVRGGIVEHLSGNLATARSTYGGYMPLTVGGEHGIESVVFGPNVGPVMTEGGYPSTEAYNLVGGHLEMQQERSGPAQLPLEIVNRLIRK